MIFTIFGTILMLLGLVVSIVFWLPGLFNRAKAKEILGKKYPLVYMVYIANGPMLIFLGLLLFNWSKVQ